LQDGIRLIVGLGNPGPDYEATRHNVGVWFVKMLAGDTQLKLEAKLHGWVARVKLKEHSYWLMVPTTFMNHCGLAVKTMANFYKISPQAILVVHDDLDFPPGTIRLKQDGGDGGHNGLRDIIQHLHTRNFHRLRIGIGHPGHKDQVIDYVLRRPSKKDHALIIDAMNAAQLILPTFLVGNYQHAIQQLHNQVS
jgi:peptidyl-tRNA hydrolase, PTH1 family